MYRRLLQLPYSPGTRILRLLGVRYYLNNDFANYALLTRTRIRGEIASPAHLGLAII